VECKAFRDVYFVAGGGIRKTEFRRGGTSRGSEHLVDFERSEEIYLVICDRIPPGAPIKIPGYMPDFCLSV